MDNLYVGFRISLFKTFIGAAFFLLGLQGFSQTQVNINKTGSRPDIEINLSEKANIPFFAQAKRARAFDLNSNIANPQGLQSGNNIRLQLLKDKDFPSTIVQKVTDVNGVTSVTVKLDDFDYAFGYIIVSEDSYLITIDIPELKEKYTTRRNKETNTDFILLLDESKMEKVEECEPMLLNDDGQNQNPQPIKELGETENFKFSAASTSNDPATIDIMIVYTPLARDWSDTYDGGINNTIATAMATANTVSSNTELGINFNLIYSGLVDYTEQNSGADLSALRINGDGLLDEVHDLRKNVGADMVVLFTNSSGGVAYVLNNKYGQTDTAFSLTGIRSAKSFTFPHELGHNMGVKHYKYQNVQPGNTVWSNWPENTWSGGWRWQSSDNNMYCDIMTYEEGKYHDDGLYSGRVPYFSDPDREYLGGQTGNREEGNARLTLREIKHVIANYSNEILYCEAMAQTYGPLYINRVSMGGINQNSVEGGYSNFSLSSSNIRPQETQTLTVDISGFATTKQLLVWVDWNEDGEFDPLTELEYSSEVDNVEQYITDITAPLGILPGEKRMRIRLQDLESGGNDSPCGGSAIGEVEDYTLNLQSSTPCVDTVEPINLEASEINKDNYLISWQPVEGINSYELRYRKSGIEAWTSLQGLKYPFHKLEDLEPETTYEVQVRSICSGSASGFSASLLTTTKAAAVVMTFEVQPVDAEAGRTLKAVSIHLRDAAGNLNSSNEEISLSLIDPGNTGAELSGKLSVVAKEGIATFDKLVIDMQGNYSLQATAGNLTAVESSEFNILPFASKTFVVSSKADNPDAKLDDEICADLNGNCTLRAAIENANKTNAREQIHFNIPGGNPPVIVLNNSLPAITAPVVLDGTTQPNYSFSSHQVVIDGSAVAGTSEANGAYAFGLMGKSSGSTIKGFTIGGFDSGLYSLALHLRNTGDHIIEGNKIGTTVDGLSKFGNYDGIYLENSNNNRIGGPTEGQQNIVSGNLRGISLDNSQNNLLINNYVGINLTGNDTIPNIYGIFSGVDNRKIINGVLPTSSNNVISENVVSGNQMGIRVMGTGNRVEKNFIGTNSSGTASLPNDLGLDVRNGSANIVGGEENGNVISGNVQGLVITNSSNNTISSNSIGTDKAGFNAIPNQTGIYLRGDPDATGYNLFDKNIISGNSGNGITIEASNNTFTNNLIGVTGDGSAEMPNSNGIYIPAGEKNIIGEASNGNIISGNLNHGIHITISRDNTVSGNLIGVLKDGSPLGNGNDGIHLRGSFQTTIGGEEGKPNLIAFNEGVGVSITEYSNNNKISQNSIYSNSLLGIDLDANGSTANDRDDRDNGPNNYQNFPELKTLAALEGSVLQLEYLVNSVPQYSAFPIKVEFFKSDGNGQGKEYLGTDIYTENDISKGRKGKVISLELVPGTTLNGGDRIVATAIDSNGNTSEFGNSVDVTGGCSETIYYADADGDALGDPNNSQTSCTQPEGYVINSDDCNDTDPDIGNGQTWYADKDADGFGDPQDTITACYQPEGYVDNGDDCNDSDDLVNPDTIWYADKDGDGFGDLNNSQTACTQPEGFVNNSDDCDDTNAVVSAEITWYADNDGDGLGNPNDTKSSCTQPIGYMDNSDDCDDSDANVGVGSLWYADADGDTFGNPNVSKTACNQPEGFVANSDDCDDTDGSVNPYATDVCSDCDPTNDAGCVVECLGTDVLYVSEVCTDGTAVDWVINNPGNCPVEVRWELRKREDFGNLTVAPGDNFFSSGTASKGSTQVTIYWNNSTGSETKSNANASGIPCTSSSATMGDETIEDSNPAIKVYPNPVTSEGIWLHFAERNKKAQFKVVAYDLTGRKMAETLVSVDESGADILWEVDHSRWIQGIYVLNVSSGNEVYHIKIIK